MSTPWKEVPLGEVITERKETPDIGDLASGQIRIVAKIGFNNGTIELREDSKTRTGMILIRPGDLVVSGINAAKGAIAIYEEKNDIPIAATIHYSTYIPNNDKVDVRYLWWFLRSKPFRDILNHHLPGGIKTELKAKRLLPIPIPFPPVPEQRRIVAKIEQLASKIEEACSLSLKIQEEFDKLCRSIISDKSDALPIPTPMRELVTQKEPDVDVSPSETYHFAGVYCFGRGIFRGERKTGLEFSYKRLTRLRTGDFVYPKLMAWEGAFGIVPKECDGLVVSPEFPVFEINKNHVLPEVLDVYFRMPSVWPLLADLSTGTNVRRRRLNPKAFLFYKFPLPLMKIQMRLFQVISKMKKLKPLKEQSQGELAALLPSILDKAFKGEL